MASNNSLQRTNNDLTSIGITDEQLDLLVEASASTGIKSKGEALMVFMKAKELGIGAGNAVPHMHVVNGKTGIDIHIIKAILSRPSSGVSWKLIDDFVPIYTYTDGVTVFSYDTLPENYVVLDRLSNNPDVDLQISKGKRPVVIIPKVVNNQKVLEPIDRITTYEFKRIKLNIKGEWEETIIRSSFRFSEAIAAKLPLDRAGQINPDSNWSKYRKLMLAVRAFTYGAREIASDLLLGAYETSELLDIDRTPYEVDEEGKVTILKEKSK